MKNCIVFTITVITVFLVSCTKNADSDPIPSDYKAYLSKITTVRTNAQGYSSSTPVNYTIDYYKNLTFITGYQAKFSYTSANVLYDFLYYYDLLAPQYVKYTVVYDSANQPVSGIRIYFNGNGNPGGGPSGSNFFAVPWSYDSIRYQTTNNEITEVKFFDRRTVSTKYPNFPSTNGAYQDTAITTPGALETYTLTYSNGDISKIHSVNRTGAIIDREYTYSTSKGVMHDCRVKPIINPDQAANPGYELFFFIERCTK